MSECVLKTLACWGLPSKFWLRQESINATATAAGEIQESVIVVVRDCQLSRDLNEVNKKLISGKCKVLIFLRV